MSAQSPALRSALTISLSLFGLAGCQVVPDKVAPPAVERSAPASAPAPKTSTTTLPLLVLHEGPPPREAEPQARAPSAGAAPAGKLGPFRRLLSDLKAQRLRGWQRTDQLAPTMSGRSRTDLRLQSYLDRHLSASQSVD